MFQAAKRGVDHGHHCLMARTCRGEEPLCTSEFCSDSRLLKLEQVKGDGPGIVGLEDLLTFLEQLVDASALAFAFCDLLCFLLDELVFADRLGEEGGDRLRDAVFGACRGVVVVITSVSLVGGDLGDGGSG